MSFTSRRQQRAAGEVFITNPTSRIYLNSERNETNNKFSEPIYNVTNSKTINGCVDRSSCAGNNFSSFARLIYIEQIVEMDLERASWNVIKEREAIVMSTFIDDSDHYYETLSPLVYRRRSTQLDTQAQNFDSNLENACEFGKTAHHPSHKKQYASAHALGFEGNYDDDVDSFDSESENLYDTKQTTAAHFNNSFKSQCHSELDVSNIKLPDPPQSNNQVYAIVKKFKKFISNKKSMSSSGGGSQQKLTNDKQSQFYVNENIYKNTPKSKLLRKINGKQTSSTAANSSTVPKPFDEHESLDFSSEVNGVSKAHHTSSGTLKSSHESDKELSSTNTSSIDLVLNSKENKSDKSFRSRLKKSLIGTSNDAKQAASVKQPRSTFYLDDSSDIGINEYGRKDFLEKTSSTSDFTTANDAETQKFSTVGRKSNKSAKSSQRRRTTIGLKTNITNNSTPTTPIEEKAATTTSWYAECGVFEHAPSFKPAEAINDNFDKSNSNINVNCQSRASIASNSSWYAKSGLYQAVNMSGGSSSASSGVSAYNKIGIDDDLTHGLFMNEPLYQIYNAAKLESISQGFDDNESVSTDGYEEITQQPNVAKPVEEVQRSSRPTALQLVGPKSGPSRTLWSEVPEVINSCILPTLKPRERALQEAKFEILTSEASYLKSLNLLRTHFMNHPMFHDAKIVSSRYRKELFAHIVPVHQCSERLLNELESCWQDNIMLLGLSKRLYTVAEKHFHVYITFCEHQGRMDRALRHLKEQKGVFAQNLELLESSAACCGLNFHSFLMLPMQRITRLPLLIDAVFSKVSPNDDEYDDWKMTLAIMNKIVNQCNEAANRCEQIYEIERISRQLEFPTAIRALTINQNGLLSTNPVTKPRFLVKKGELTHLIWRSDDFKLTFGKKFTKVVIYAYLFTDLIVLTKKRSEDNFVVFDYCPRNMLTISTNDVLTQLPMKDLNQTGAKNLMLMTLLENHEGKTIEMLLSCSSVSEQERWLQAMRPPEAETPGEKLYEQWDCPQVIVKHTYQANEPDGLNLELGDVINVTRKLPDGWFHGERIRDGAEGWFPGSYTEEVNSAHVRARNLKQRYRLLTFTATYLDSKKQK